MTTGVQLTGVAEAERELQQMAGGAAAAANLKLFVGTGLIYAAGIHEGHRADGRLARRAGGVFFMARAAQQAVRTPGAGARLAEGVRQGPAGARQALYALAFQIKGFAQLFIVRAPAVDSGALANSIEVTEDRPLSSLGGGRTRATVRSPRVGASSRRLVRSR